MQKGRGKSMVEHTHKFTLLNPGPPKTYGCSVLGCSAQAEVDPVTKGPGKTIELPAPVSSTPPPAKREEF